MGEHGGNTNMIHHTSCKGRILDLLEREDIRLHDGENEMSGEGGREDGWWPEALYESHQLTSKQRKGRNTVVPFYDHHKSRLVETMTFWAEYHGGFNIN